jgi:two-component system, NtrC family, response regulator AtoC
MTMPFAEGGRLRLVGEGSVPCDQALPAAPPWSPPWSSRVVGRSPAMVGLQALTRRAAAGSCNVLITGETGAGKDVVAETLHRLSPRAPRPFLPLNCAGFSESLVDAELFGHERGAFTGAVQARVGLLETAAGGTVFLDEVGEMSLAIQAKLLRVIETRQVLRIGALRSRPIDFRLVAATNRDLEAAVKQGRFRLDLLFRLDVIRLEVPPLRARPDELEPLAQAFLVECAGRAGRPPPALSAEALAWLSAYPWPGNIRELRNVIERAALLCSGETITSKHLPVERLASAPRPSTPLASPATPMATSISALQDGVERDAIIAALARCHGNQTRAAALLGMPRRTFCKRLVAHAIPRPRARPPVGG